MVYDEDISQDKLRIFEIIIPNFLLRAEKKKKKTPLEKSCERTTAKRLIFGSVETSLEKDSRENQKLVASLEKKNRWSRENQSADHKMRKCRCDWFDEWAETTRKISSGAM